MSTPVSGSYNFVQAADAAWVLLWSILQNQAFKAQSFLAAITAVTDLNTLLATAPGSSDNPAYTIYQALTTNETGCGNVINDTFTLDNYLWLVFGMVDDSVIQNFTNQLLHSVGSCYKNSCGAPGGVPTLLYSSFTNLQEKVQNFNGFASGCVPNCVPTDSRISDVADAVTDFLGQTYTDGYLLALEYLLKAPMGSPTESKNNGTDLATVSASKNYNAVFQVLVSLGEAQKSGGVLAKLLAQVNYEEFENSGTFGCPCNPFCGYNSTGLACS